MIERTTAELWARVIESIDGRYPLVDWDGMAEIITRVDATQARLDAALALLRRAAVHVPAYYELRKEIDAATGEAAACREGGGA